MNSEQIEREKKSPRGSDSETNHSKLSEGLIISRSNVASLGNAQNTKRGKQQELGKMDLVKFCAGEIRIGPSLN